MQKTNIRHCFNPGPDAAFCNFQANAQAPTSAPYVNTILRLIICISFIALPASSFAQSKTIDVPEDGKIFFNTLGGSSRGSKPISISISGGEKKSYIFCSGVSRDACLVLLHESRKVDCSKWKNYLGKSQLPGFSPKYVPDNACPQNLAAKIALEAAQVVVHGKIVESFNDKHGNPIVTSKELEAVRFDSALKGYGKLSLILTLCLSIGGVYAYALHRKRERQITSGQKIVVNVLAIVVVILACKAAYAETIYVPDGKIISYHSQGSNARSTRSLTISLKGDGKVYLLCNGLMKSKCQKWLSEPRTVECTNWESYWSELNFISNDLPGMTIQDISMKRCPQTLSAKIALETSHFTISNNSRSGLDAVFYQDGRVTAFFDVQGRAIVSNQELSDLRFQWAVRTYGLFLLICLIAVPIPYLLKKRKNNK